MIYDKLCAFLSDQLGIDPADIRPESKVIDDLVASTDGANRERVETLVGENVQLFDGHKELFENVVEAPPNTTKLSKY